MADFATYGIDDLGDRFNVGPQLHDPNVHVQPVLGNAKDQMVAILNDPAFRRDLEGALGPFELSDSDFGRERYIRACIIVTETLNTLCGVV